MIWVSVSKVSIHCVCAMCIKVFFLNEKWMLCVLFPLRKMLRWKCIYRMRVIEITLDFRVQRIYCMECWRRYVQKIEISLPYTHTYTQRQTRQRICDVYLCVCMWNESKHLTVIRFYGVLLTASYSHLLR